MKQVKRVYGGKYVKMSAEVIDEEGFKSCRIDITIEFLNELIQPIVMSFSDYTGAFDAVRSQNIKLKNFLEAYYYLRQEEAFEFKFRLHSFSQEIFLEAIVTHLRLY